MQVIVEHAEIVEAIKLYFKQKYGMVIEKAYTTYPYKRGRPRDVQTIWAVEAPLVSNPTRPSEQIYNVADLYKKYPSTEFEEASS